MNWKLSTLALLLLVSASWAAWGSSYYGGGHGNDAVLLENVRALTLERGKYTNARRVSAIPQLTCIGGNARGSKFEPSIVQCENMGSDGYDIQWKCTADLDNQVKFGKTEVVCEGYNNPDDNYILKGSCGLEYTLEYTSAGQNSNTYGSNYNSNYNYDSYRGSSSSSWGFGTWVLFAVAIFIAWNILKQCSRNSQSAGGYNGGGNHGSNYGGNNNDGNDYPHGGPGSYGGYPKTNTYGSSSSYVPPPTSGYTPGFWSGLGGGSLLGYLFGSRSHRPSYYGSNYGSSYGGYGSGFGSGFGSRPSSFGSGGFGGSSSSGSRTSSGYGGTRRR